MIQTRPDIAFATSSISQWSHNPSEEHEQGAQQILQYLDSTVNYYITYRGADTEVKITRYVNANFTSNKHTSKSTTGYVFMFNGGPISWCIKRQATITLLSTEAKYITLCQAAHEAA